MGAGNEMFLLAGIAPSKEELVDAIPTVLCQRMRQRLTTNDERVFHVFLHDEGVHREDTVQR